LKFKKISQAPAPEVTVPGLPAEPAKPAEEAAKPAAAAKPAEPPKPLAVKADAVEDDFAAPVSAPVEDEPSAANYAIAAVVALVIVGALFGIIAKLL